MAMALMLCLIPWGHARAATVGEGKCGDNLTWKLSDTGVLTISGEGDMDHYNEGNGYPPWWRLKVKSLVVKEGVTSIGNYAFDIPSNLTSVTLADSVTYIGRYAFGDCGLKTIDLPANLKTIDDYAFVTNKLTEIKLPSKLKTIGAGAFSSNPLESVTIPASVTFIGNEQGSPFSGITSLKEIKVSSKNKNYCAVDGVLFNKDKTELIQYPLGKSGSSYTIPSSVDKIGDEAFSSVTLKQITIPKGVKEIGRSAFHYAHKLTEVEIPSTVKSIDPTAFDVCYALKKFTVSSDNKYYTAKSGVLFNKDLTELLFYPVSKITREYAVPDTVEHINGGAFRQNDYLFTLTLSKNLKSMGGYIVEGCDSLNAVIFRGDAPECAYYDYVFSWDGNLAYYPYNNATWTQNVLDKFQDNNTFYAYDPKMKITGLKASNNSTSGQIKLSWDAVEGATKYWIFKSKKEYGEYWYVGSTSKTSFTDTSNYLAFDGPPDPGEKYYYRVQAVTADSVFSLNSDAVGRTCNLPRVTVTAKNTASSGKVKLTWKKVNGAKGYAVYRATKEDGTYKKLDTVTATSFTDSTGKVGTRYYYKVVALHKNSSADSAKSTAVARNRDLSRPDVTAKLSSGNVKLTWETVSGAEKYKIYRATSKDGEYTSIKTTTKRTYTDKSVKNGKTYYYKVKAIHTNSGANSAYSSVASVKVK